MSSAALTIMEAVRSHEAGDFQRTEQLCRELLRVDPAHHDALYLLGMSAAAQRQNDEAISNFERLARLCPHAAEVHLRLAQSYRNAGRSRDAVAAYSDALKQRPDDAGLYNDLGVLLQELGENDGAVACFEHAVQLCPDHPETVCNLAAILHERGRTLVLAQRSCEALPLLQRAVELNPDSADVHATLGHALRDVGRLDEAVAAYRRSLQLHPASIQNRFLLAKTLLRQGENEAAVEQFEQVKTHTSQPVDVARLPHFDFHLGTALKNLGRYDEALSAYQAACRHNPEHTAAPYELGNVYRHQRDFEAARDCYQQVLRHNPDDVNALISLGNVLKTLDEQEAAARAYNKVLRLLPEKHRWELWIATLCPAVFESNAAIDEYRNGLQEKLRRIAETGFTMQPAEISVSACPAPYNLQFHGRDDRPLKRAYAEIYEAALREEIHRDEDRPRNHGRPKVGLVVTAGHEAVFLRYFGEILRRMTFREFDVEIVCAPSGREKMRNHLRRDAIRFRELPSRFDSALESLRNAQFDVLYYWEIGSDTTNYFLPFFRLAPVQCTAAGLPVTSGMRNVDYFLSTDSFEPADGDEHYTERLIRAETLLTDQPRLPLAANPKRRADFGFRPDQHVYLCPHKIEKFHPDLDPIFAEILQRDPHGVLVIPADAYGYKARKLRQRLAAVMPDVIDRVTLLPRQSLDDYLSLTAAADVLLDPLHYGGGLTAMDGFSMNKPIVTLPGRFVRGRYTAGYYGLMGVQDCIAADAGEYVQIALRLGTDPEYRRHVESRIAATSGVLFDNHRAATEHEEIFERLIAEARD